MICYLKDTQYTKAGFSIAAIGDCISISFKELPFLKNIITRQSNRRRNTKKRLSYLRNTLQNYNSTKELKRIATD